MSPQAKRRTSWGALLALLASIPFWAAGMGLGAASEVDVIVLEARAMAFTLPPGPGSVGPNPPLVVAAGSNVRLEFTNRDAGVVHEFAIEALGLATGKVRPGETAVLTFKAPGPGEYRYLCPLHGQMMEGLLMVHPRAGPAP